MQRVSIPPRVWMHWGALRHAAEGEGAKAFLARSIPEDEPQSNVDAELARLHEAGLRNPGFVGNSIQLGNMKIPLSRVPSAMNINNSAAACWTWLYRK